MKKTDTSIRELSEELSHACYLAVGADLGDFQVQRGTDACQKLHSAATLALRLFQEDPRTLGRALKGVTVQSLDISVTLDIAGLLLAPRVVAALMDTCRDAHARRGALVAAHSATLDTLASPNLEKALGTVEKRAVIYVPGASFLNFMTHEGVPAWILDAVRPEGIHAEHGMAFEDLGNLCKTQPTVES